MNISKSKRAPGKFLTGVLTLVMSLALLLGSAQISLAKNTPIPDPSLQSGVTDGGGGGVDVEGVAVEDGGEYVAASRTGSVQTKHNGPYSSHYYGNESVSGALGSAILEWSPFGYYEFVFDIVIMELKGTMNQSTPATVGVPRHE